MTVVCGNQVAQPHMDTGADKQKSSTTPVGGSGELLQALRFVGLRNEIKA